MADRLEDEAPPESPSPAERKSSAGEEIWGSSTDGKTKGYDRTRYSRAYMGDRRFYRTVVKFLGSVAVLAVLGTIILGFKGDNTSDPLIALGSASIGALASLVASGGRQ